MEGDQEKAKTLHKKKKKKTIAQAGRTTTFMGGGQTKNKGGYKKEQETVTGNIVASGAGGEDLEQFMRRIGKGSATAIVRRRTTILQVQSATCRVPGKRIWTHLWASLLAVPCLAGRTCNLLSLQMVWLRT